MILEYKNKHYDKVFADHADLKLFYYYLIDDVGPHIDRAIAWLHNTSYDYTHGNFSYIEKLPKDKMIMGCMHTDEPEDWAFECSIDQLVSALQQWKEALKNAPHPIMIQRDDDGDFHIFALPEKRETD